ncbi:hypothetical protein [Thiohalospira halophila]|uniref:hypothetical protein n=1 Tax=Thiohalospira halophila TaxID=381300 RepID=UPI00117D8BD2|nr:hypothetical protein [Thiohalospira halophila]
MEYTIYRLQDPRDGVPFYVGQSRDFEQRKDMHLRLARKPLPKTKTFDLNVYLTLLLSEGYDPIFEVVDVKGTEEDSLLSETEWVRVTVKEGFPVLNRWKTHRSIVKEVFTSDQLKRYFCSRFPPEKVSNYAPSGNN